MFSAVAGSTGDPDSGDGYYEKVRRLAARGLAALRGRRDSRTDPPPTHDQERR